jgi:preprotein translocase subunit Sec63
LNGLFTLPDLAELEYYANLKEAHLHSLVDTSVKEALPILKRCTHLRRLTLASLKRAPFPSSEELCDFIMELKDLTFLHIIYRDSFQCNHFKSEVDGVKDFVLPLRPNFKFYISCCDMFKKSRVSEKNNENK